MRSLMTQGHTELRHAVRGVAARPAFSSLIVLVLVAGLGCVLYVAGMINGLVVQPLPFADPGRLYDAGLIDNDDAPDSEDFDALDTDEFLAWRRYLAGVAEVAGYGVATVNLSDNERPERYSGAHVTANLWATLGVGAALGRGFTPADEVPGAAPVVVLSDEVWRARYLADTQIVGRQVRVNAASATVVGVMPPGFSFPMRESVWLPTTLQAGADPDAAFDVILRPHAGVGEQQLRAVFDAWFADASRADPERMRSRARAVGLRPLSYRFVDRETRALFASMFMAVLLVLMIACANVANLLFTQLASRQQELAMRVALGATPGRLAAQLIAQSGVLCAIALALALPLAQGMVRATARLFEQSAEDGPPHWMRFDLDATLVLAAIAVAGLTALLAGALPAWRAASSSQLALREGRGVAGAAFARVSRVLVIGEIALSCALLIAATVLIQAVVRLDRFDLGLDTERVLTARVGLFAARFPEDADITRYAERLLERLRREPGVVAATLGSSLPGLMGENVDVLANGAPTPSAGLDNPGYSAVDERFLEAMGGTLVSGRFFDAHDDAQRERVIVVDQTFVDRYLGGGEALGRRYRLDPLDPAERGAREATIVGVVRPIQLEDIDDPREPTVLEPYRQRPTRFFSVFVRTRAEPATFAERLRGVAAEVDADTPLYWVRGYDEVLREATFGERVLARLFSGFGLIALLLAAAGLYGVVAYTVGQRTREIGVRRALGAPDRSVLGAVAGRSGWQVLLGLGFGVLIGIPFAGALAAPIAEVVTVEPSSWLLVIVVLALVAALAVWVPARRALAVDPMVALRYE
jgi:predicted permease